MKRSKLTIAAAIFLLSVQCLPAQNPYKPQVVEYISADTVDTAILKIQYSMTFRGLYENDPQRLTDTRTVWVGRHVRKDSSYWMDKREAENLILREKGKMLYMTTESTVYPIDVMISGGKATMLQRTLMNGPILRYEVGASPFGWNFQPGDTVILGHRCKRAVAAYKGRSYEAWYAEDVPVGAGPYLFDGLPGLILKITSADGDYSWEATGLEESDEPIVVKDYGSKVKPCAYGEARKIMENVYKHPYQYARQFVRSIRVRDASGGTREAGEKEFAISFFYNPIEVE